MGQPSWSHWALSFPSRPGLSKPQQAKQAFDLSMIPKPRENHLSTPSMAATEVPGFLISRGPSVKAKVAAK